jgi:hypothetical protein
MQKKQVKQKKTLSLSIKSLENKAAPHSLGCSAVSPVIGAT